MTPPLPNEGAAAKLRILVVEDVDMIAQVVEFLAQRAGVEFLRASNGEEAVSMVIKERPDFILMDLQMPVMDGIEATRSIRDWEASAEGNPHHLIYAFTAKCVAGQEAFCLDNSFDGFVGKPVSASDFLALMEKVAADKNASSAPSS
jgi:CheY-like chemotaxis protein